MTVIPEELIKQTNATTFADALKTVPGITFLGGDAAANPSADRPVIRGFESRNSIFVDGIRDSGVQNRETFDVESISVIKGPDSVYAGRGAVGGSIDIVTKTPKNEDFINGSVGLGWQMRDGAKGRVIFKDGAMPGFSSYMAFAPSLGTGVVVLSNQAKCPVAKIASQIMAGLGGAGAQDLPSSDSEE